MNRVFEDIKKVQAIHYNWWYLTEPANKN